MSPAPQRSTAVVQLPKELHQQIVALADSTNTSFQSTLETLVKLGLSEQSRRETELKNCLDSFLTVPEGTQKDVAMNLLGEAIFGK